MNKFFQHIGLIYRTIALIIHMALIDKVNQALYIDIYKICGNPQSLYKLFNLFNLTAYES